MQYETVRGYEREREGERERERCLMPSQQLGSYSGMLESLVQKRRNWPVRSHQWWRSLMSLHIIIITVAEQLGQYEYSGREIRSNVSTVEAKLG